LLPDINAVRSGVKSIILKRFCTSGASQPVRGLCL
jgi:hypothetical protein